MFKIPGSVEEATEKLADLDGLITARSWQRAAIVYAFVRVGSHGGDRSMPSSGLDRLTPTAFARLGINGLRSAETVRAYHGHWQYAIDQGLAEPVLPGQRVAEPDLGFPPNPDSTAGTSRSARSLPVAERAALVSDLLSDPQVASEVPTAVIVDQVLRPDVAAAVANDPHAIEAVENQAVQVRAARGVAPGRNPRDEGRRVGNQMAEALDTDLATGALHNAASSLGEAILCKEQFGIRNPAEESEALAQIDRLRAAYSSGSLSEGDRGWLDSIGVTL